MRTIKQIKKELQIIEDKIWYDRHQILVDSFYKKEKDPKVLKNIKKAIKVAKEMEKKYGKKNLGPYENFEWGMLNGRLETLRWMLGDDWGNLDT